MAVLAPAGSDFLSGWQELVQRIAWSADHYPMARSITVIAVTGLLATVGLTFAMNQALKMQPDRMGEGEVKEHYRLRFRPHSESEPKLQIKPGSEQGKILIKAWIEPKITEDRQRLGFTLRDFLWRAPYKSGRPESVRVVFRDPVTGKSEEREMSQLESRRAPRPAKKKPVKPELRNAADEPRDQSVPKDRSGKGFRSQSSSSKTR